jgi:putative metallohydrolase (TIGR04338 family)
MFDKPVRDFQRNRVYTAERRVTLGKRISKVPDIQAYVNSIISMPEFRNHFPRCHFVDVKDGRGCRRAYGSAYEGFIKMPVWSRHELIIIHEVAHVVSPLDAHHGPVYCGNYLWLINLVMGKKVYLQLRESFLAHGVKFEDPIAYENPAKKALEIMLAKKARKQSKEIVAC